MAIGQLTASVQAQGRDASAIHLGSGPQGRSDAATDAALALAASSLRMRAAVHDLDRLRAKLRNESQDAWLDLHAAGAALVHAASLPVQTPLLATTMALWLTDMPEGDALVDQQLATAEQLVGQVVAPERRSWLAGDNDEAAPSERNRAAPWAAWRMLARGRLQARHAEQTPTAAGEAVRALEAALRLDPSFKRGQVALAEALVVAKRKREAIALLHKLVQSAPGHLRARALLARLES